SRPAERALLEKPASMVAATEFRGAQQKPSRHCLHSCWQSPPPLPPPSEPHRCLIRTGSAARVAYLIGVGSMATASRGISVEPVIQGGDDQPPITIDVDIARSRPRPGEIHGLASVHFVAAGSEDDLS